MRNIYIYTSAALNYLPKVRLLFQSIKKNHPDWKTCLVLIDELAEISDLCEPDFDYILPASQIGIPNFKPWAFCHNIVELATAVKPFFLRKIFREIDVGDIVFYFDPDIVIFSNLDELVAQLDVNSILLTPHQSSPDSSLSAIIDNEICSLKHGTFNLGFIGVKRSAEGEKFADWWSQRLYHFCRADIANGLFTDQKWIDLVPVFFKNVHILTSPRFNVAPWNLSTRILSIKSDQFLINGEALGFYHFTGFDSGAHKIMSRKNGGDNPAVSKLVKWYKDEMRLASSDPLSNMPWSYGHYSDSSPILNKHRLIYRERKDLQRDFKDPFDSLGYKKWITTQGLIDYPDLDLDCSVQKFKDNYFPGLTLGYTGGEMVDTLTHLSRFIKNPILTIRSTIGAFKEGGISGIKKKINRL